MWQSTYFRAVTWPSSEDYNPDTVLKMYNSRNTAEESCHRNQYAKYYQFTTLHDIKLQKNSEDKTSTKDYDHNCHVIQWDDQNALHQQTIHLISTKNPTAIKLNTLSEPKWHSKHYPTELLSQMSWPRSALTKTHIRNASSDTQQKIILLREKT